MKRKSVLLAALAVGIAALTAAGLSGCMESGRNRPNSSGGSDIGGSESGESVSPLPQEAHYVTQTDAETVVCDRCGAVLYTGSPSFALSEDGTYYSMNAGTLHGKFIMPAYYREGRTDDYLPVKSAYLFGDVTSLEFSPTAESVELWYCTELTEILVPAENGHYSSEDGVLFDGPGETLLLYPAKRTETEYAIPDGTKRIEAYAFENCQTLKSLKIPDSVSASG